MLLKEKGFVLIRNLTPEGNAGSHQGMSYKIREENGMIAAYVYPDIWSLECTAPEYRTHSEFQKDEEGMLAAIEWINQQYELDIQKWDKFKNMTILDAKRYHI